MAISRIVMSRAERGITQFGHGGVEDRPGFGVCGHGNRLESGSDEESQARRCTPCPCAARTRGGDGPTRAPRRQTGRHPGEAARGCRDPRGRHGRADHRARPHASTPSCLAATGCSPRAPTATSSSGAVLSADATSVRRKLLTQIEPGAHVDRDARVQRLVLLHADRAAPAVGERADRIAGRSVPRVVLPCGVIDLGHPGARTRGDARRVPSRGARAARRGAAESGRLVPQRR